MIDIHSCSYFCDRPECVRRQRDEMRDRMVKPSGDTKALVERLRKIGAILPAPIYNEAADTIEQLERDLAAAREDAERWRYITKRMTHEHCGPNVGWTLGTLLPGDSPEAAIDAARKERG
jgi:hypothetical protein